jgi:hypothetical protein
MEEPKSILLQVLGDYPQLRVLDFLMENYIFDYPKTQIAELSGVSFNTMETFWDKLIRSGMVERTRRVGKSEMYRINRKNPVVKKLFEIDKILSDRYSGSVPEERVPA